MEKEECRNAHCLTTLNVTEKPLDSKPTQEQKQQIKSCTKTNKGKSKPNNAISAMFAKVRF